MGVLGAGRTYYDRVYKELEPTFKELTVPIKQGTKVVSRLTPHNRGVHAVIESVATTTDNERWYLVRGSKTQAFMQESDVLNVYHLDTAPSQLLDISAIKSLIELRNERNIEASYLVYIDTMLAQVDLRRRYLGGAAMETWMIEFVCREIIELIIEAGATRNQEELETDGNEETNDEIT